MHYSVDIMKKIMPEPQKNYRAAISASKALNEEK
jgi:hypothetical protein